MNDIGVIKLHNAPRAIKREKIKYIKASQWTPPKLTHKNSKRNAYRRIEKKKGYNYPVDHNQHSRTMKWMQEQFHHKMAKYLGNQEFVKKQSRMDKVIIKQKLNFKNEINPLLKIFNKAENKARKGMLWDGMAALKK